MWLCNNAAVALLSSACSCAALSSSVHRHCGSDSIKDLQWPKLIIITTNHWLC